ncbi:alcohol dehydrogenase [Sulfodiicoccus acidiphilus]|uniref:Alcohol dehydrogenase n=1 Tax=Sulfodiicoccus acidiphilus TaxID=1670455 RepID=A0A348B6K6_9CREN|nr:alcohol dehydrogenase catalytic domain-containing protein [Sulfodiicoccus acidiphilus]BBD73808.1 alcohol dehydrogenase [Sulfodiicoccus acidiphilus]GGU03582.1 alcohol dehydrogenase [Sulfodiicoccus acidiphilus]
MRAAVYDGAGGLKLVNREKPLPGDGEILVRVAASGVCHSDVHLLKSELLPVQEGFVLGHEVSGWVEALGPGTTNSYGLSPGDQVVVSWILPCGKCRYCATGKENYCRTSLSRMTGIMGIQGGHADYLAVPEIGVIPLAKGVDVHLAAPISCAYGTAYNALKNAGAGPSQSLVVVGTGGVGSSAVQLASAMGMYPIIAVDVVPEKLEKVQRLGATHVVDASKGEVASAVNELLPEGADVVYETKPNPDLQLAMDVISRAGTIVVTGLGSQGSGFSVPTNLFVNKGIRIVGSLGYRPRIDLPELVTMVASKRLDPSKLITHRYSPERIGEAYANLEKGLHLRAIVDWN